MAFVGLIGIIATLGTTWFAVGFRLLPLQSTTQSIAAIRAETLSERLNDCATPKASRNRLLLLSLASIFAIAVILYIDFQSWKLVGIILCTLPLALLGGVLGVHASGGSIWSWAGEITTTQKNIGVSPNVVTSELGVIASGFPSAAW